MFYKPFSLDISGVFSVEQARQIIFSLQQETKLRNVELRTIDVTIIKDTRRKVIIQVWCKKHERPVACDSACDACLEENNDGTT